MKKRWCIRYPLLHNKLLKSFGDLNPQWLPHSFCGSAIWVCLASGCLPRYYQAISHGRGLTGRFQWETPLCGGGGTDGLGSLPRVGQKPPQFLAPGAPIRQLPTWPLVSSERASERARGEEAILARQKSVVSPNLRSNISSLSPAAHGP